MKREIKFRGKRHNGSWVYGDLCTPANRFISIRENRYTYNGISHEEYEVYEDTIGQFTGLTDKKGREIYEGDVLRINNGDVICLLVVTWNAEVGSWCLRFKEELKEGTRPLGRWLCDRDYDIELTGNIYDNKELLEE